MKEHRSKKNSLSPERPSVKDPARVTERERSMLDEWDRAHEAERKGLHLNMGINNVHKQAYKPRLESKFGNKKWGGMYGLRQEYQAKKIEFTEKEPPCPYG